VPIPISEGGVGCMSFAFVCFSLSQQLGGGWFRINSNEGNVAKGLSVKPATVLPRGARSDPYYVHRELSERDVEQVRVLPLPVYRYRRLRIQGSQGRVGLGYRFTVSKPLLLVKSTGAKLQAKLLTGFILTQVALELKSEAATSDMPAVEQGVFNLLNRGLLPRVTDLTHTLSGGEFHLHASLRGSHGPHAHPLRR
jgi:hypothetical protein